MTYMLDDATRRAPVSPNPSNGAWLAILLTVIFAATCVLKIAGVVPWSWAAILAPVWLPWAAFIVFCGCGLLLAVRK